MALQTGYEGQMQEWELILSSEHDVGRKSIGFLLISSQLIDWIK